MTVPSSKYGPAHRAAVSDSPEFDAADNPALEETVELAIASPTGAGLILSSETLMTVNLCLLLTFLTFLFLLFVFSLMRIGSDSTLTTVALHMNSRSSMYGLPLSVKSLLPMIEARSKRRTSPTLASGMRNGSRIESPGVTR